MDKHGILYLLSIMISSCAATSEPGAVSTSDGATSPDVVTLLEVQYGTGVFEWPQYDNIRLPSSLRPRLYNITIKPMIYGEMINDTYPYYCNTTIYLDCLEDTSIIRLHLSKHLVTGITLSYADDAGSRHVTQPAAYRDNAALEMIEIYAGIELRAGQQYMLTIESVGTITNYLTGLYYSPYKENGETRYIITTMMEPTCARLVFPCFDEPDMKAVYLLNLHRRADSSCIANLPRRTTSGPDSNGFYVDVFDQPRNVPMSTYLVAFACGDIDYLESHADDIRFRTYTRRSVVNHTAFALEMGVKTHTYFEKYFNISYPLPKQDMVAVPTMSFNAMEHFGMITYREEAMLWEPGVSSEADKEWTAILVAHEISHQWFGNIVSPHWWDDLWLNEGFATYMMFLCIDTVIPEWNMMNKQVLDFRGIQNVFSVDDKLSSHPVYIPVSHPNEINEIFDLISYAKGSAVIRMIHFFLGESTFKNGLTEYLNEFSYKTATHDDLWRSLEKRAIADKCAVSDVKLVMDTWLKEKNYPVVMVTRLSKTRLRLSQAAFLMDADERLERANIKWEIPVTYTTDKELGFEKTPDDITWLHKDGADVEVTDPKLANTDWIIANVRQYGFFRVNYDAENWQALIGQLKTDHSKIHPINRAQLIDDAWNLAKAGLLDFETALKAFDYIDAETDYVPWKAALRQMTSLREALQLTPLYGRFEDFMRQKLKKAFIDIKGATSHYDIIQYSMLAKHACIYGVPECIDDVMAKFNQWMKDGIVRDPNLQSVVYCTGVEHGGRAAWDHVLQAYTNSDSAGERMVLLAALGCTKEPWIIAKLLDLTVSSDVLSQNDRITVISYVASNPVGRLMTWGYLEKTWDRNYKRYGSGLNLFTEMIKSITRPFNTRAELKRVEVFLNSTAELGTATRAFHLAQVDIRANIDWLETHYDQIQHWLNCHVDPTLCAV